MQNIHVIILQLQKRVVPHTPLLATIYADLNEVGQNGHLCISYRMPTRPTTVMTAPYRVAVYSMHVAVCSNIASFPGLSEKGGRPGDYCVRMRESYRFYSV